MLLRCTLLLALALGGCSSSPQARQTGFLSDYQRLERIAPQHMGFLSPELRDLRAYIVEDPQVLIPVEKLSVPERDELARHLKSRALEVIESRGFAITSSAGPGTGRVRLAITDIAESTWWMKIHPGARLAGAGTGGAAMEGEIVDSVTGRQLAAAVVASPASQFDLTAFSTVADVKNTIDLWARRAGQRLDALLATGFAPPPSASAEPGSPAP